MRPIPISTFGSAQPPSPLRISTQAGTLSASAHGSVLQRVRQCRYDQLRPTQHSLHSLSYLDSTSLILFDSLDRGKHGDGPVFCLVFLLVLHRFFAMDAMLWYGMASDQTGSDQTGSATDFDILARGFPYRWAMSDPRLAWRCVPQGAVPSQWGMTRARKLGVRAPQSRLCCVLPSYAASLLGVGSVPPSGHGYSAGLAARNMAEP